MVWGTLSCPGEAETPRMTKAEAKASVKDMGDFADFMKRLEETHVWSEEVGDFVERAAAIKDGGG